MKNTFTTENASILLIDHQVGTMKLAASNPYETVVHNTRALARAAVGAGMPLVLTSSQEENFQGLLIDDLQTLVPDAYEARIKRPGVINCWSYEPFKQAAIASGRKKLVMAGVSTDVCITFPSISAVEDGFDVQVVIDACGTTTKMADDAAIERMRSHGVTIVSASQALAELAVDWSTPHGSVILGILYEELMQPLIEG